MRRVFWVGVESWVGWGCYLALPLQLVAWEARWAFEFVSLLVLKYVEVLVIIALELLVIFALELLVIFVLELLVIFVLELLVIFIFLGSLHFLLTFKVFIKHFILNLNLSQSYHSLLFYLSYSLVCF